MASGPPQAPTPRIPTALPPNYNYYNRPSTSSFQSTTTTIASSHEQIIKKESPLALTHQKSSPINLHNIPKHWIWNTSLLYASYNSDMSGYGLPQNPFTYSGQREEINNKKVCEISSDDSEDQDQVKDQSKVNDFFLFNANVLELN